MSSSPARRDLLALTLAAAAWGVGTVITKRALDEIPPLTLLPIQLGSSLIVLALLMRRRGMRFRGGTVLLGRLGILNPGLAYALSLLGLVYISASLSVLLWAIEPLMILVLATWLLRERVTPTLVLFSLIAMAGMVLVIYDPATSGQLLGVVLTLAGVACCAAYTVIARRWLGTADSTAHVVFAQQAHALVFSAAVLAAVAVVGGVVRPVNLSPAGALAAVTSGVLYYAGAYWLYLNALRVVPASLAAVSFYLIPVFGVAAAFVLLHERFDLRQWIGVLIVLSAIFAIIRQPARDSTLAAARL
jgi:probable blue pigment (indigoidine) exporter